jgi:hypothetical protein
MKSRMMGRTGHLLGEKGMRNAYKNLAKNPEENKPIWRKRSRWENNFKMDLKEIMCEDVDLIHLVQDTDQWLNLANTVMKIPVP